jgi:hypothetical protein
MFRRNVSPPSSGNREFAEKNSVSSWPVIYLSKLADSFCPVADAMPSSETSVLTRRTQHHIPKYEILLVDELSINLIDPRNCWEKTAVVRYLIFSGSSPLYYTA